MRRCLIFLLGGLLLLLACHKKEKKITYKLSDRQMTQLVYDVQLSDAVIINVAGGHGDSLKAKFFERLTTVYGLSREEIKAEIQKLESDPDRMKAVYDSIKVWSDTIK